VSEVAPQDAGGVIVCAACGSRNEGPLAAQDGTAWAAMRVAVEKDVRKWKNGLKPSETEGLEACGGLANEVTAMRPVAPEVVRAPIRKSVPAKNPFGSPLTWAVGVVLVMLAIVLPFAIAKLNEPKKTDYSELTVMQQRAEMLAAKGDLPAAEEAYGLLFDKAGEQPVDDPLVLERLARAKRDEQRVVKILNERERQEVEELRRSVVMVTPTTMPIKAPSSNPVAVVAKVIEAARTAVAATQPVAIRPTTQPIALRPTTQPAMAMVTPTTIPTSNPAVAIAGKNPLLPRPPTQHLKPEDEGVTDQEIGEAIQKGANFLLLQFNNGHLAGNGLQGDAGLNAAVCLCTAAVRPGDSR
jgi:hypothetical protein